jgi:hypothetical protein
VIRNFYSEFLQKQIHELQSWKFKRNFFCLLLLSQRNGPENYRCVSDTSALMIHIFKYFNVYCISFFSRWLALKEAVWDMMSAFFLLISIRCLLIRNELHFDERKLHALWISSEYLWKPKRLKVIVDIWTKNLNKEITIKSYQQILISEHEKLLTLFTYEIADRWNEKGQFGFKRNIKFSYLNLLRRNFST